VSEDTVIIFNNTDSLITASCILTEAIIVECKSSSLKHATTHTQQFKTSECTISINHRAGVLLNTYTINIIELVCMECLLQVDLTCSTGCTCEISYLFYRLYM